MPKFDLSDIGDFSRVTQGALGNLNTLFGGRDPKEWDIREASFNGIKFHVFALSKANLFDQRSGQQIEEDAKTVWEGAVNRFSDFSGRRKVKYSYPYRDGQTTDDLGRKAQSFEVEALIFGNRYMEGYTRLMKEFDKPTPGKLVHPVRGEIDCVVEDVQHVHAGDSRKAVALKITFTEHNFTAGTLGSVGLNSVKSKLTDALQVFKTIDGIVRKVEAAQLLARGIKNLLNTYLAIYKRDSARTLTKMNQTFNTKGGSTDIPALLPVNLGGSGIATSSTGGASDGRVSVPSSGSGGGSSGGSSGSSGSGSGGGTSGSSGLVQDTNFVVVRSVSDPFNGVPVADLTESTVVAVAVTQLEKEVQALRDQATTIIKTMLGNGSGAALELNDSVIEMRQTVVIIQQVLEAGAASSNARIINYIVPRLMSIREVAFANGITPDRVQEVDLLNPALESVNFIEKGTVMRIPSA